MTPSLAARIGFLLRPGFLLYVLFWVVLVSVIWNPSVWRHTSRETSAAIKQQDPFDLRFPVEIEPGYEGPQPQRDPIDTRSMPSLSKLPFARANAPQSLGPGVDPKKLRRLMDLAVPH